MDWLKYIPKYLHAMWADWTVRMSTGFSLLFILLALIFHFTDDGHVVYWLSAAVGGFVITSFWVWYKSQTELTIDVEGVYLDSGITESPFNEERGAYVTIRVILVNTNRPSSAIKRWELVFDIDKHRHVGRTVSARTIKLKGEYGGFIDLQMHKLSPLPQGWPTTGWVRFIIDGLNVQDIKNRKFTLSITDAYNVTHKIKVRTPLDTSREIVPCILG